MSSATSQARDQLVDDLKAVIDDAEELLKATAGAAGDKISGLRARTEERLRAARARLADAQEDVIGQAKDAARATDTFVHEHPWGAIGVAAAAGLLVGLLIARR
jgi:ElaB/YqjD/DUF883 family membrane-anchored ribosome-binding protein